MSEQLDNRAYYDDFAGWYEKERHLPYHRMLDVAYEDVGALHHVRVHVPDRPGVLQGITQALGAERINIEDFELHHMSPERGGTLQVLVEGEGEAQRAAKLLEGQGYSVVVSPVLDE